MIQTFIRSREQADGDDVVRGPGGVCGRLVLRTDHFALIECGARLRWIANSQVPPSRRERQGRRQLQAQAAS